MSGGATNGSPKLPPGFEELIPGAVAYQGPIPFDDLPFPEPANAEDYDWALNSRELHRRYPRMVVAVHRRQVWGVGRDYQAAWEDARKKSECPAERNLAFVALWGVPGDCGGEAGESPDV
jgi:hypothetical protein